MDFHDEQTIIIAFTISNIVAVIMLWAAWKRPAIARVLYSMLFLWASWVNSTTSFKNPEIYLEYADFTFLSWYKSFILGFFRENAAVLVLAIAVCQFLIGISMWLKGSVLKTGLIGGMLFLVAIAPLGVGSAFPATLIMAGGLYLLHKKDTSLFLWQQFAKARNKAILN